jgi:hypothetical protein
VRCRISATFAWLCTIPASDIVRSIGRGQRSPGAARRALRRAAGLGEQDADSE